MKRLGAIFLLAVFIFNSVGPFLKFVLLHQKIVHQMQDHILYHTEKELYTVTVTPKNAHLIRWQHQHEFSYHGVLFDVVEKEVISVHKIVYHCIADYKETALFADLDHFIKKDHPHKGHFKIPKVQLFQWSLPEKQFDPAILSANWNEKAHRRWLYQLNYSMPLLKVNSPPPEHFLS